MRKLLLTLAWKLDRLCHAMIKRLDPMEQADVRKMLEGAPGPHPPRNCDVGTPKEQAKRFKAYCKSKVCKRNVCHCYGYEELFHHECFPVWGQMPYEKGESGER